MQWQEVKDREMPWRFTHINLHIMNLCVRAIRCIHVNEELALEAYSNVFGTQDICELFYNTDDWHKMRKQIGEFIHQFDTIGWWRV